MVNENRIKAKKFDQEASNAPALSLDSVKEEDLEYNKFDNVAESAMTKIEIPSIFTGKLKDYQLRGVRWLDNLYD